MDAVAGQSVRQGIFRARPKTLAEAIQAALETQSFEEVESQRREERPFKFVRAVDRDTEERLMSVERTIGEQSRCVGDLTKQLDVMVKLLASQPSKEATVRVSAVPLSPDGLRFRKRQTQSDMKCFNCGERGHFASRCRGPIHKQGNDEQSSGGSAERLK